MKFRVQFTKRNGPIQECALDCDHDIDSMLLRAYQQLVAEKTGIRIKDLTLISHERIDDPVINLERRVTRIERALKDSGIDWSLY